MVEYSTVNEFCRMRESSKSKALGNKLMNIFSVLNLSWLWFLPWLSQRIVSKFTQNFKEDQTLFWETHSLNPEWWPWTRYKREMWFWETHSLNPEWWPWTRYKREMWFQQVSEATVNRKISPAGHSPPNLTQHLPRHRTARHKSENSRPRK
jgi:hypothetical protein